MRWVVVVVEQSERDDAQRAAVARVRAAAVAEGQAFALLMRSRAEVADVFDDGTERAWADAVMETAGTARVGQNRASTQLSDGRRLVQVLHRTLDALEAGSVFRPSAELLLRLTRHCRAEVADVFDDGTERAWADAVMETAGTARVGQNRASTQLSDGRRLVRVLHRTLDALEAGSVFRPSAELLLRLTRHCTDEVAAEVEARVLARLTVGTTTEQRRLLARTVVEVEAELDPAAAEERERLAAERAGVWVDQEQDGRCVVGADLDVLEGRRWELDFTELVRAQAVQDKQLGVTRTRNQRRAAVFAALPSQLLALLQAVAAGRTDELLSLVRARAGGPDACAEAEQALASLEDLADSTADLLALLPDPPPGDPASEPVEQPAPVASDLRQDPFDLAVALCALPVRDPQVLNVHVPMGTLLDVDQRAGHVDGVGPISPFRVRLMAPTAVLRRVVTDARTGQPQAWETYRHLPEARAAAEDLKARLEQLLDPVVLSEQAATGHDPTPTQAALVRLRDGGCTCPGCSTPAPRCDLDHERRHPDGPTATWNLSAKSRRCHLGKHDGWTVVRDEHTGTSTWTSRLGHTYTSDNPWSRTQEPTDDPPH